MELSRKGILDEVEKLFMAKEIKQLGQGSGKKDDKKQIISTDLRKAFGKSPVQLDLSQTMPDWVLTRSRNRPCQILAVLG